jgi:hypothetical protein
MDANRLATLIQQPQIQRVLLGNYQGAYSLGVTTNPGNPDEVAIRLRIEGTDTSGIPEQITLDGVSVPVLVSPRFAVPVPLSRN